MILLTESAIEIRKVAKAALEGDSGNRLCGFLEQAACVAEADLVDECGAGLASHAFEKPAEGSAGGRRIPGENSGRNQTHPQTPQALATSEMDPLVSSRSRHGS